MYRQMKVICHLQWEIVKSRLIPDRRRVANNQQGRQQLVAGQEGRRSRIRRTHPVARVAGVEDGDAGMLMMMIFCVVVIDVRFHDIYE